MSNSILQHSPKSQVLEHGYINIYSQLNSKERKQVAFKSRFKKDTPTWDETMVFLSQYFRNHVSNDAVVLDAGCGNGNYVIDENRKKIAWAVGIDASEESTKKNICLDEKRVGDLESLPFPDNNFDAVISLWVIEHLRDPEKVFYEINRVLKPGGVFMFATPNQNFFPLLINRFLGDSGINRLINSKLYGRDAVDIFKTYYNANTKKALWGISDGFEIEVLRYNFDPSYTSFDNITYGITTFLGSLGHLVGCPIVDAHIVGVFRKK